MKRFFTRLHPLNKVAGRISFHVDIKRAMSPSYMRVMSLIDTCPGRYLDKLHGIRVCVSCM